MKIFKPLALAALIGCATLAPGYVGAAEQPKVIKVDASVNTQDCPQYQAFMAMKKYIEDKSGGRYRVDVYDSGKLGSPANVLQGLKMGTIQIAMESASNVASFLPVLGVLDSPFLFNDAAEADRVLVDGPLGEKLLQPLNQIGIKPFGFVPSTFRWMLMKEPLHGPEDIKGQKIRATASNIDRDNLKAMGFSPAAVTGGEMISALQQGVLDGVALPSDGLADKALSELTPYAMDTEHAYMAEVLVCSDRWFKSLPPEDQQLMLDALKYAKDVHGELTKEIASVDAIRNTGLYKEVVPVSPEFKNYLRDKSAVVYETLPDDWKAVVEEVRANIRDTEPKS